MATNQESARARAKATAEDIARRHTEQLLVLHELGYAIGDQLRVDGERGTGPDRSLTCVGGVNAH